MSLIGRIFVIIFAVIVASIAAGVAIAIGIVGPQWHGAAGPGERMMFWGVAFIGSAFTGSITILPLAICIAIAETFKIRSMLINTLAGAVLLLAGYYGSGFARPSYEESIDRPPPAISHETEIAAASGAVFGLLYWLIAGRNAGRWREKRVIG
jgi:putative copper export protein